VVVVAAENQRALAAVAERAGAAVVAPTPREAVTVAAHLLAKPSRMCDMSEAGRIAVDGHGARRIARTMNRLSGVRLRRACMHDARLLHEWRNHPSTRAASHQGGEIPWETHVKWLEDSLARTDRHVLVAERGGHPVGTLRFDVVGESATVSIAVEPGLQGAGFGPAILDAGHAWIPSHDPRVRRIRAEIRDGNTASVGAFIAAGYSGGPNTYERPIGQGAEP
jgi:RimJ/RimL family protein N-acetyltransferase